MQASYKQRKGGSGLQTKVDKNVKYVYATQSCTIPAVHQ